MRYGVMADIHGNAQALHSVLGQLERHGVDRHLVAGDLVGYGANPNECVEMVAELDAICVAGNHDLITLGRLSDERCIPMAQRSLRWTRRILTDTSRDFLSSLPLRTTGPGGVVLAHGSLEDPQEYTTRPRQAAAQLLAVQSEHPGSRVLVVGHTHRAWAYGRLSGEALSGSRVRIEPDDPILLNPGAVGQSREVRVRARFVVLDLEKGEASFHAVRYEVRQCREALRQAGLDRRSYHLPPSPASLGLRIARTLRSRAKKVARRHA